MPRQTIRRSAAQEGDQELIPSSGLALDFSATTPRFQLDVVVAQYAEILRESIWAQQTGSDLDAVASWGDHLAQVLPDDPDVAELVGLMCQTATIGSR